MMNKSHLLALLLGALVVPAFAADEPKKEPEPDWKVTGNAALSSQYIYRGIKQTNSQPAYSGGFDVTHSSGFYIGNWNSSISWISDFLQGVSAVSAPLEMDLYGGYKLDVGGGVGLDFGGLYYYYPKKGDIDSTFLKNPNTLEIYVAGSYGPATLKYSYANTELFGALGSKKSGYVELSGTFDVGGGVTLIPHVGHQQVKTDSTTLACLNGAATKYSYTDYNVKATYDLFGWTLGGLVGSTNAKKDCWTGVVGGKNLGGAALVLSIGKSF